jgi:hypothetical protein
MQALGFKLTLLKVFLLQAFSANSPDVDFTLEAAKSTQTATGEADEQTETAGTSTTSKELLEGQVGLALISTIDLL